MDEALEFFLNNQKVVDSLDSPDEAIDYIFMLSADDLKILTAEWDGRGEEWKEGISYLLGNLEPASAHRLILKALKEPNAAVVEQALLSLHQSITEAEDVLIPEDIKQAALTAISKIEIKYPEIKELGNLLAPAE